MYTILCVYVHVLLYKQHGVLSQKNIVHSSLVSKTIFGTVNLFSLTFIYFLFLFSLSFFFSSLIKLLFITLSTIFNLEVLSFSFFLKFHWWVPFHPLQSYSHNETCISELLYGNKMPIIITSVFSSTAPAHPNEMKLSDVLSLTWSTAHIHLYSTPHKYNI